MDPRILDAAARHFQDRKFDGMSDPISLGCHLDPKFVRRRHLTVIGNAYQRIKAREIDRLVISTPPQVGKSTGAVKWGAFWWLAHHPTTNIALGSYAESLAVTHGRSVRKLVEEYGKSYDLELDTSSHAANDWKVLAGGGMRSVGVRGGITGRPADFLFVDDPHKDRAEADSKVYRDAVYNWWSGSLYSRLSPGAIVVVIQTRWHPDDLIGRILKDEGDAAEGGRWTVINMPALCTNPATDPLSRRLGEPLSHPKLGESESAAALRHWEDKRRVSSIRDWGSLYQGDPKPAGGTLLSGDVVTKQRFFGPEKSPEIALATRVAVSIDPSGERDGSRDTAGIIAGYLGTDQRVYFTHDRTGNLKIEEWSRAACALAHEIKADVMIFEANYGGDMARKILRTAWEALASEGKVSGVCPNIKAVQGKRNKYLRAEPVAHAWKEDWVRTAAYLPDLESEWTTWVPGADSPGRIDASTYLVLEMLPTPGTQVRVGAPSQTAKIDRGKSWATKR